MNVFHRPLNIFFFCFTVILLIATDLKPAHAQEQYLGEVILVPYNFAPRGWAFCEGQLLPISENEALFTLIGTTFGGDGQTTFALPDYRGRFPLSAGQGPGLSNRNLGEAGGVENITLTSNQMPVHTHPVFGDSVNGSSKSPKNALPGTDPAKIPLYGPNARTTGVSTELVSAGNSQPHDIRKPFLALHWIIALEGIYPTQNNQSDKKSDDKSGK